MHRQYYQSLEIHNMKMPTELKIGSRIVPVKMVSFPDVNMMGQYDPEKQVISISKDMKPSMQIETMWHEMMHAIHDYIGTQASIANEIAASQADGGNPDNRAFNLEEHLTNGFSNALVSTIKENNLLTLTT